ncbi:MAG: hypothetical protein IIC80_07360 [Chloroflexi bacterium]|nr:hypothetical protein [Chloroflexota bacterium]
MANKSNRTTATNELSAAEIRGRLDFVGFTDSGDRVAAFRALYEYNARWAQPRNGLDR